MQTSLRDLTDDRSTANEVTAISAFAIYADSTDTSDATTGGQPKQSGQNQGNRWKCKVKDCDKFIGKKFQAECTERKKKLVAEGKWNNSMQKTNVCYNCDNRLKQGEVTSLKLKNGKDYTLPEKQSDGRANNVNTDDTASDDKVPAAGAQDDDMTSKILDVLGKVFVSGTGDTTAAPSQALVPINPNLTPVNSPANVSKSQPSTAAAGSTESSIQARLTSFRQRWEAMERLSNPEI